MLAGTSDSTLTLSGSADSSNNTMETSFQIEEDTMDFDIEGFLRPILEDSFDYGVYTEEINWTDTQIIYWSN